VVWANTSHEAALVIHSGAALLVGCGFHLRQAPDFVFSSVVINAPASSPLAAELRRSLAADGKVQVVDLAATATPTGGAASAPTPAGPPPGQIVFDLLQELREKVVVGMNSTGQVTEFQVRSRLRFRVRNAQGRELIPDTELEQHRDITFNEAAVLAKEAEESPCTATCRPTRCSSSCGAWRPSARCLGPSRAVVPVLDSASSAGGNLPATVARARLRGAPVSAPS
jgi:LPS-assembly lipoprotein